MKNRIAALSLTLALSVGLCAPVQAADSQTVQATLNAGITVTMDGTPQTFHDAQGAVVLPVTYNGTTYLPVRAVSALVGLGVEWEAETQTVKLTTPETPTPTTSPADGTGDGLTSQTVPALLNGSITVTLDGAAQTFHDAQGAVVLPITYNGTTYLPVRAVCGLVSLPVEWVQETSTVKLGGPPSAEIPEGATQIIDKSQLLDSEQVDVCTNGFYFNPNLILYGNAGIAIPSRGYTTITFTIRASTVDTKVDYRTKDVNAGYIDPSHLKESVVVNAGEVKTFTFDCSGTKSVSIDILKNGTTGVFAEGWITDIYLY